MKRDLACCVLLVILICMPLWAGQPQRSVMLAWDASPTPNVSYKVYYGEAPGQYTVALNVGEALTASIAGLKPGQVYYFAVTAVNPQGESIFSNEVSARGNG